MHDRPAPACYLTDATGVRYRVLDAVMRGGAMIIANPPAAWAKFRVFRPGDGQRRLYYFRAGDRSSAGAGAARAAAAAR